MRNLGAGLRNRETLNPTPLHSSADVSVLLSLRLPLGFRVQGCGVYGEGGNRVERVRV